MQRPNGFDHEAPSNSLRRSIFLSESEALRKQRDFDTHSARKLVTASTFIKPNLSPNPRRLSKHTDLPQLQQDNPTPKQPPSSSRPLSYRSGEGRRLVGEGAEKASHQNFNSHLVQLKMEEMAFKFKSRVGTLLKEMSIAVDDLSRFSSLAKIDDILDFLSQKIRERLLSSQISENNVTRVRCKEKEELADYQAQVQSLQKRLLEKQASERVQKAKIKETHAELRDLYDKLGLKEKDLSCKVTELYQARTLIKENEKLVNSLQAKCLLLEKERSQLQEAIENSSKNVSSTHRLTEQQNRALQEEVQELKEALQMALEKEESLLQLNSHMEEEVARWRQRFEEEPQNTDSHSDSPAHSNHSNPTPNTTPNTNASPVAIPNNTEEVTKMSTKIRQQQSEIKRLNKQVSILSSYKDKYENVLGLKGKESPEMAKIERMKEHSVDLFKLEMEAFYSKRMEEMSTQWRDKLVDMVETYTKEEEQLRQEVSQLQEEKQALEKKVFALANEKYIADCKVIEKDAQIYQLSRLLNTKTQQEAPQTSTQELLISSPALKESAQMKESVKLKESLVLKEKSRVQDLLKESKEAYSIDLESKSSA